jgi:hypothetical protein
MNKEFIPYEQALELKELGFNEPCAAKYNKGSFQNNSLGTWNDYNDSTWGVSLISAPLYQQAFRWFRDRYGYSYSIGRTNICVYHLMVQDTLLTNMIQDSKSYEEAELKCIQAFIDAAKQNSND